MVGTAEDILTEVVWVDPERMSGVACFAGTRLPIELFFQCIRDGMSVNEFLESYDSVDREQIQALLNWSSRKVCQEAGALENFV